MTTQKVSKEAQDVLAGVQNQETTGTETVTVQEQGGQQNVQTTKEESTQTERKPAEQQKVAQPKVIEIGKRKSEKTKEVAGNGKENAEQREAAQKAEEEFEKRFNARLSERFKVAPERISEVLEKFPQYEERLNADPYKDPFTKSMDELIGKGIDPDTAYKYLRADVTKMSPKELKAFKMQIEYPEMAIEKIHRQIDRQYKLGEYAPMKGEGDAAVRDETDGLEQLEFDVMPIKKEFDELRGKTLEKSLTRSNVESQQKETQRIKSWAPVAEKILDEFTAIEVHAPNGNILRFAVEMSQEEQASYAKEIGSLVKSSGWNADESGIKAAQETLKAFYIAKNFNKMAVAFAEQGRSMSDEEWMSEIHNPSLGNTNGKSDFRQPEGNRDDQIVKLISGIEGAVRKR